MALIDKDGQLQECSSVRFEGCFEFPAKRLNEERNEDSCKIC